MRILVIASCFAPKNVIGAVRTTKIVKYLVRAGHDVTVISPVLEDYDSVDDTLECDELAKIRRITVPYSRSTSYMTRAYKQHGTRHNGNQLQNRGNISTTSKIYRWVRGFFSDWRDYEWTRKVKSIIREDSTVYDLVLSSYPNLSTHKAAYFTKRAEKASKWIADFRDPLVLESSFGSERKKLIRKQTKVVHEADLVTHVSRSGVDSFVCKKEDHEKVIWIPNGFDTDDLRHSVLDNIEEKFLKNQLVFSYAGGLYAGERDCTPLFKAIRELADEKQINLDDIIFCYAGRDYDILKRQAETYHVSEVLLNNGLISREKSLEMQAQSDCVVVATFCYQDHGGAMTGKIYEPIMMCKPILLLVSGPGKYSEPGEFINYLNAGTVYEEASDGGNVEVIKEKILQMIEEKHQEGSISTAIDNNKRNQFEYKNIVNKLLERVSTL